MSTTPKPAAKKAAAKSANQAELKSKKVLPKTSQSQSENTQLLFSKRVWPD